MACVRWPIKNFKGYGEMAIGKKKQTRDSSGEKELMHSLLVYICKGKGRYIFNFLLKYNTNTEK